MEVGRISSIGRLGVRKFSSGRWRVGGILMVDDWAIGNLERDDGGRGEFDRMTVGRWEMRYWKKANGGS